PGPRDTQGSEVGVGPCNLNRNAEGDGRGAGLLLNNLNFKSLRASGDRLSGICQGRLSLEILERLSDLRFDFRSCITCYSDQRIAAGVSPFPEFLYVVQRSCLNPSRRAEHWM